MSVESQRLMVRHVGPRWLQKWSNEVGLSTKLLYFSLTTFLGMLLLRSTSTADVDHAGSQTLGEEYTDILQYSSKRQTPSRRVRSSSLTSIFLSDGYIAESAVTGFAYHSTLCCRPAIHSGQTKANEPEGATRCSRCIDRRQ